MHFFIKHEIKIINQGNEYVKSSSQLPYSVSLKAGTKSLMRDNSIPIKPGSLMTEE